MGRSNGYLDRIEVLTFVDNGASIEWMKKTGAKIQNLLTKGSLNHLEHQLKQKPIEHFKNISKNVHQAEKEVLLQMYISKIGVMVCPTQKNMFSNI